MRLKQAGKEAGKGRQALWEASHLLYVNASHQGVLRRPGALRELAARRPVAVAAYIHDLIPIEYPEYTRADQVASLETFFAELFRHPVQFAVNSGATGRSLQRYLHNTGNNVTMPRPEVIYPGFTTKSRTGSLRQSAVAEDDASPNFVILGTIEPRKNHLLLLHIWRQLAEDGYQPMPKLTIIGRRGWDVGGIAALLDRSPSLRPHVRELSGLTDRQMFEHLQSATALLFPSFAEGFGLPLMEAAELGVPVIAADHKVFRELVADGVTYLSPLDGAAWKAAIINAVRNPDSLPSPILNPTLQGWSTQRQRFAAFIARCAKEGGR